MAGLYGSSCSRHVGDAIRQVVDRVLQLPRVPADGRRRPRRRRAGAGDAVPAEREPQGARPPGRRRRRRDLPPGYVLLRRIDEHGPASLGDLAGTDMDPRRPVARSAGSRRTASSSAARVRPTAGSPSCDHAAGPRRAPPHRRGDSTGTWRTCSRRGRPTDRATLGAAARPTRRRLPLRPLPQPSTASTRRLPMTMPTDIGAVDLMIGFPSADARAPLRLPASRSCATRRAAEMEFPAEYMFKDVPNHLDEGDDPVDDHARRDGQVRRRHRARRHRRRGDQAGARRAPRPLRRQPRGRPQRHHRRGAHDPRRRTTSTASRRSPRSRPAATRRCR